MTGFEDTVLVFEDLDDHYAIVSEALDRALSSDLEIKRADLDREFGVENGRKAVEALMNEVGRPLLIVLDWDLSRGQGRITRDNIVTFAENNHLPLCIYHRTDTGLDDNRQVMDYEEDRIKINPSLGLEQTGEYCGHVADGFNEIRATIADVFEDEDTQPLPELLDAPLSVRGKLDQYSWGNPGVIKSGQIEISEEEILRRATTNQGYWILNELLEFPGALLNETALAAYLNVDHEQFSEGGRYKEPFAEALYTGPFSELENWWWTPLIDDVRIDAMSKDDSQSPLGPELFIELNLPEINEAICHSERNGDDCSAARYYCIIKEKPVCKVHSVAPEGWIPKGATRSRVSEEEYDQLKPWVMM